MSRNHLHRSVEVDGKKVDYAINRRGCKGRWTKTDDAMMRKIVAATVRMASEEKGSTTPAPTTTGLPSREEAP